MVQGPVTSMKTAVITHSEGRKEGTDSGRISETEEEELQVEEPISDSPLPPREIVWGNVYKFIILHSLCLYGLTLLPSLSLYSWIFLILTMGFSGLGITAGAHRLWAHKTYKASIPLRVFLLVANSMAGQNSAYVWSRDHRLHHKASETHADPHNSKRGFFFAHMGWLMVRKHPSVAKAGKSINMSDLESDSLVMFQHKHYMSFFLGIGFILPTLLPNLLWGETLATAYFMAVVRYVSILHFTWLVNSAAHMFGMKPYDKNIGPAENMMVSVLAMGEGFHNYHHTFPYDYSTSEWGFQYNLTTIFLDMCCVLGLAWDRRTASNNIVMARANRTGHPSLTRKGIQGKHI